MEHSKRKVSYYYDDSFANYYYTPTHVMKPQRVKMTHELILSYGIDRHMQIFRPIPACMEVLNSFHDPIYSDFLERMRSEVPGPTEEELDRFNFDDDCPLFPGLLDFCKVSVGGSYNAAIQLNTQDADIAINWMGGLHHARKDSASGFCYTNDIVIGILKLLEYYSRVLYVDIDVHHGDGVEQAFYTSDRVMTVSFHNYDGKFFPSTGKVKDVGSDGGKLYSVNVPLKHGINDQSYQSIFVPIMTKVMERYDPSAVVLQCGADSLNDDLLGPFNLTLRGHGECVNFFRRYNIPLMLLGGGGYTPRNVARCWTYETALACGIELSDDLPQPYHTEYYGEDRHLHISASKMFNKNTKKHLLKLQTEILKNLEQLVFVPSVQMQPIPEYSIDYKEEKAILADLVNPDVRLPKLVMDKIIKHEAEFYEDDIDSGYDSNIHDPSRELSKLAIKTERFLTPKQEPLEFKSPSGSPEEPIAKMPRYAIRKKLFPIKRSPSKVRENPVIVQFITATESISSPLKKMIEKKPLSNDATVQRKLPVQDSNQYNLKPAPTVVDDPQPLRNPMDKLWTWEHLTVQEALENRAFQTAELRKGMEEYMKSIMAKKGPPISSVRKKTLKSEKNNQTRITRSTFNDRQEKCDFLNKRLVILPYRDGVFFAMKLPVVRFLIIHIQMIFNFQL